MIVVELCMSARRPPGVLRSVPSTERTRESIAPVLSGGVRCPRARGWSRASPSEHTHCDVCKMEVRNSEQVGIRSIYHQIYVQTYILTLIGGVHDMSRINDVSC